MCVCCWHVEIITFSLKAALLFTVNRTFILNYGDFFQRFFGKSSSCWAELVFAVFPWKLASSKWRQIDLNCVSSPPHTVSTHTHTHRHTPEITVLLGGMRASPYSDILPDKCISIVQRRFDVVCVSALKCVYMWPGVALCVCAAVCITVCEVYLCTVDHQWLIQSLNPLWTTEAALSESTQLGYD